MRYAKWLWHSSVNELGKQFGDKIDHSLYKNCLVNDLIRCHIHFQSMDLKMRHSKHYCMNTQMQDFHAYSNYSVAHNKGIRYNSPFIKQIN